MVLVDEFQDTDPVQWSILRRAFAAERTTLVLIGDPKQAIYAFRGADVYTYLAAARAADVRATLQVNWRSDQGLIDAHDALFAGARLGHPEIVGRRVRGVPGHQAPRLHGAGAPLRARVLYREEPALRLTGGGSPQIDSVRAYVASDVAADVVKLLRGPATIEDRAPDGASLGARPVRPGDVAVLVPTNRLASLVRDALDGGNVPAVTAGAGSVFATVSAQEWLRLLEAVERPASSLRAHAVALTCFLGWDAARIAAAGESEWEEVHRALHDWARILRTRGVAALARTVTSGQGLPARVLAHADGERRLTDLRHVAELAHQAAEAQQLGVSALVTWLRGRIAEADRDVGNEERTRRLDTDAEAVQVLTVHRCKGLEFGIVYAPFLWEAGRIPGDRAPISFHDPDGDDQRTVDVSLQGADYRRHRAQAVAEERGEELRLAYVALTRARHQAVIWWASAWRSEHSPLGRLLFARDEEGNVAPHGERALHERVVAARLEALGARTPGRIAVERCMLGMPSAWTPGSREPTRLAVATFQRRLDARWRRTSYSDITAGADHGRVESEPEEPDLVADEPPGEEEGEEDALGARGGPGALALAAMPGGVHVGTLIHRVLRVTDFTAGDLEREVRARLDDVRVRRAVQIGDPEAVVAGLRAAIETPLGPLLGGVRLRDVARADRLDELAFELPLAGGDEPTGRLALDAVAGVLREHVGGADHPLAGYAERLGDPALRRELGGYLTGSLDLVIRLPGPRFAVLDYKTNRLAVPGEPDAGAHYRPAALSAEMRRAHYSLQALLYVAALHRYLRWRLPGYRPERHLAGVLYLFLRGMTGPERPALDGAPCGVWAWRPTAPLLTELSDALDGAAAGAG